MGNDCTKVLWKCLLWCASIVAESDQPQALAGESTMLPEKKEGPADNSQGNGGQAKSGGVDKDPLIVALAAAAGGVIGAAVGVIASNMM
jgi:hypothetical protein